MKYVEDLKSNKVPWVLGRWPQTDQELWLFVKAVWGVEIPYRAICPGHVSPFQAFADAYFARHTMAIWEGSRGFSGKTFTLALLSCTEMLSLRCFVTILGGSAEQSLRVHEAMQTFLDSDNTPPSVKGLVDIMTRFDTRLLNGAKARTLMASQKSVRGPHPQRLRLDEVDEMDWELFKAAQGQPMRSRRVPNVETQTVASSTHQHCLAGKSLVKIRTGEVQIDKIKPGTDVFTSAGWKKVIRIYNNGVKEVVDVKLSNGKTLTCTPDHLIHTNIGWLPALALTSSSIITGATSTSIFIISLNSIRSTTFRAYGFSNIDTGRGIATVDIDFVSNRFKMARSTTRPIFTQVVKRELGLVSFPQSKSSDMGKSKLDVTSTATKSTVTSFVNTKLPNPAFSLVPTINFLDTGKNVCFINNYSRNMGLTLKTIAFPITVTIGNGISTYLTHSVHATSVSHGGVEAVYDLEVEDQHEYVAEGVLVHNCDGTMTKIKQEAKVKGWPLFRWCYKETSALAYGGWLQQDEIERKRHEISAEMWKMEYDLLEPNFEGRAIDALALERMFDPALGTYKGVPHRYHQFFDPRRDRDYITGVDWAKEKDFTVVWTWDTTTLPWMCVAFQRFNRLPWPVILKMVNMRLARWGGKFIHDATGLGNVTSDLLVIPENMSPRDVKNQILAGRERSEILSEYVAAIENDSFKAPRILWAYDEHRFCNNDNLYGREHLPDSICAAALAWHMRKKSTRRSYIVEPDVTSDAVTRETGISPWKLV